MAYQLTRNWTDRAFAPRVPADRIESVVRPARGESIAYFEDGDVAVVLDRSGTVLALYEYRAPVLTLENYLNA
jgi:hypothetical protein